MSASIVIPVRGQAPVTRQCLENLARYAARDVELIVVDDGSDDETSAVLGDYAPAIRVIPHETSLGFAVSCNDGAAAAGGEYVIFLNNDTRGEPGWLERLVEYADAHDDVAAVGSRLLTQAGTVQHAGIVICHDLMPRHVYRGFSGDHPAVRRSRAFTAVTGACMLVRRAAFEDVGGFDPAFVNGFDDVDLCLRLRARGGDVHYCAESTLVHLESATRRESESDFDANAARYLERWAAHVVPDDLRVYVEDGLIEIDYSDVYPFALRIDPELAAVRADVDRAFELLTVRSRQVFELLQQNTRLRVRLGEDPLRIDP